MTTTQAQVTVHQFSRLFTELCDAFPNAEIIELRAGCIGLRFEPGVWIELVPAGDGEYRACVRDAAGAVCRVGGGSSPHGGLTVCAVTSANGVHAVRAQVNELARLWRARLEAQQAELNSYLFAAGLLDAARCSGQPRKAVVYRAALLRQMWSVKCGAALTLVSM